MTEIELLCGFVFVFCFNPSFPFRVRLEAHVPSQYFLITQVLSEILVETTSVTYVTWIVNLFVKCHK